MKGVITLLILLIPYVGLCQQTFIPDDNFEQALIEIGLDSLIDNLVLTSNIDTVEYLKLTNLNISSLEGIQDFSSLKILASLFQYVISTGEPLPPLSAAFRKLRRHLQYTASPIGPEVVSTVSVFLFNQIHCRLAGMFENVNGIPKLNFDNIKQYVFDAVRHGFLQAKSLFYRNSPVSLDSINDNVSVNLITHDKQVITCYESEDLTWLFL